MPKPYKEDYLQKNLEKIIALIQKNMRYPKRAKRFNIQGKVLVEFVLHVNGEVKGFKTIKGHRLLKKSAINAIKEASKQFPKVKKTLKLRVPIMYKLT
jgi:protein TonB